MNNILGLIISIVYIGGVILLAGALEGRLWTEKEYTRKTIHILLGNWWFIANYFFNNIICMAILPLLFVFINFYSYKKQVIKSMERGGGREDLGTVYYAISLLLLTLLSAYIKKPYVAGYGILMMAYGDGLAAVFGSKFAKKHYQIGGSRKSIIGSFVLFLIGIIITGIFNVYYNLNLSIISILLLSILGMGLEMFTPKGYDNLSLPIGISLALIFIV